MKIKNSSFPQKNSENLAHLRTKIPTWQQQCLLPMYGRCCVHLGSPIHATPLFCPAWTVKENNACGYKL